MAINLFKKEKTEVKKEKKVAKPKVGVTQETKSQEKEIEKKESTPHAIGHYVVRPHITEKATDLGAKNQYVFVVASTATKKDIEQGVERLYNVHVEGVNIINVRPKKMRLGRTRGVKKGYKKAVVKIKEGQSIEVMPT